MNVMQAKNGRWYQVDGAWVPSVTTILSVFPKGDRFDRWLGESSSYDEAIAKRDAAGERGTIVHDMIARLIAGEVITLDAEFDPKALKLIQGFVNFWHERQPVTTASEIFLVGDGYAGTCDWLGWIEGEPWLLDFKSSAGVYNSYHAQTAAYAAATSWDEAEFRWRRGILHLKTTTKRGWQLVESDHTDEDDYAAFLACKTLYHYESGFEPIPFDEREEGDTVLTLEEE